MAASTKLITIIAVALVAAVGVGVAFAFGNNGGSEDTGYSIIDGSGKEIKLTDPVDSLITVNTNAPKAIKIIGADTCLKGISFYTSDASKDASNWEDFKDVFPNTKHMPVYNKLSAEVIVQEGVKYVLCPVKSMTVSEVVEKDYNKLGITVIRLDFNGEEMFNDFEKLVKICYGKDGKSDSYDKYVERYNGVVNSVLDKVKSAPSTADKTFYSYFASMDSFYNQTAVLSKLTEEIYGKNALRDIPDLSLSGVTNAASTLGMKESVLALDSSNPCDKFFFRTTGTDQSESDYAKSWESNLISKQYNSLAAIQNSETYMINSDFLSGPISYMGYVLIAEACGIDTGYNIATLVSEYKTEYGFNEITSNYMYRVIYIGPSEYDYDEIVVV